MAVSVASAALIALAALAPLSLGSRNAPSVAAEAGVEGVPDLGSSLFTFGSHQYWVVASTHPKEAPVAAAPDGSVWMAGSPARSLGKLVEQMSTPSLYRTADGGQSWSGHILTGNLGVVFRPEGDVVVAPNGDVLSAWMTGSSPHSAAVYVKEAGLDKFELRPVSGPSPSGDRPTIMVSSAQFTDPRLHDYLALVDSGAHGVNAAKRTYATLDGGRTWILPVMPPPVVAGIPISEKPLPLGQDPYLDYAKPFAQGMRQPGSRYIPLSGGAIFSPEAVRWTGDLVTWHQPPETETFPTFPRLNAYSENDWPWWDSSSAGVLFAARVTFEDGWKAQYKWYDGAWHDGGCEVPLSAAPQFEIADHNAALRSHGTLLGFATREGDQDLLIRIWNATSPTPSCERELIGRGQSSASDFPSLAFDSAGRAIVSFDGGLVAYATSP